MPITVELTFERRKAPIDLKSLRDVAKKIIFTRGLTDRVQPYVSARGLTWLVFTYLAGTIVSR